MTPHDKPFVTIAMPALNEEAFIASAIASIVPRPGGLEYELLILDGGSSDRTPDIVRALATDNPRIRLIHNEGRIQAAAINLAARLADPRSRYLVRADCHSRYPERFVEICIDTLVAKQVASVVVPMRTEGTSCMQRAIAGAQNSRLGNGGSPHRTGGRSAFVEHGHHAAFDRQAFLDLSGYDETFTHNEDAEFDVRLVRSGRRIFLQDAAAIHYSPRSTLGSLARQYRSYGAGTAKTARKHTIFPKLRRALPVAIFIACILSLVLAPVWPALLMIPSAYLITSLAWGPALAWKWRDGCLALSGLAAVVMHMSWAAGFLRELATSQPPAENRHPAPAEHRPSAIAPNS